MNQKTTAIAISILVLELVAIGLIASSAGAVNNTTANPYNNTTPVVDNGSWMQGREDPTLDNSTHFVTRIGTFILGNNGGSAVGSLLIGLLVMGFIGAAAGGSRFGVVAGAVIGMAAVAGLVEAGFAPVWTYGVLLFILGILATIVWRRGWGG